MDSKQISGPMCHPDGVCGYGNKHAKIMFIGIAPGRDEILTGMPFTGPSGKQLNSVLEMVGLNRQEVYCTNLICWYKDAPDKDEIDKCHKRLTDEIALINPAIVVLMGKIVTEYMLELSFSKARGAVLYKQNRHWLSTYHPASYLHKAKTPVEKELQINAAYDIARDLSKLPDLLNNKYPASMYDEPEYEVVADKNRAQSLLDAFALTGQPVAIDIETTFDKEYEKEHPFDHDIICIGIGNSDGAVVLTRQVLDGLTWPECTWVFHNGAFDTQEMKRILNVDLPISEDTMLMSYSVDERGIRGLHKLKPLSREFVGASFYEENEHHSDLNDMYAYNAKDVVYTHRLYNVLKLWQEQEQTRQMYTDVLLPTARMLARSQYRGIYIDPIAVEEIEATLGVEYIKTHVELSQMVGASDFNPNSPKQVLELLHSQGIFLNNTAKATLNDYLDSVDEDVPFIRKLLRYRMLAKLITTYLWPTKAQIKYDGRVHPHSFVIGTVTGRLTYKEPPMQTLPKEKTVGELGIVRKIFSASSPDYGLLEVDYEQIEAWIAQWLSGDPKLLEDMQSGSWHDRTTMDVFKKQKGDPQWAFYRDAGKHLNYGCLFEEGPEGLTRRPPIGLGCSYTEAQAYHKRWYQRYSVFDQWRKQIKLQAQANGYLDDVTGRKRRFPMIVNDHQMRQMVNSPIQMTANEYSLINAVRLEPALRELDTHLLMIEHDGTYYEYNKKYLDQVVDLLGSVMTVPLFPSMPAIPVTIEIGPNLAELERI